jgi:RimJ/RimL family protein N-acetyltransferase
MAINRLSLPTGRPRRLIIGGPTLQLKVTRWVIARLPELEVAWEYDDKGGRRPLFSAIGLLATSPARLLAGVVYEGYNGTNVNAHVAAVPGRHWFAKAFLGEVFRYPFEQLRVRRITGKTPASNQASLDFQKSLGFTVEGLCRKAMPNGEDMVITGMLKEDCRWLEVGRHGFERWVE